MPGNQQVTGSHTAVSTLGVRLIMLRSHLIKIVLLEMFLISPCAGESYVSAVVIVSQGFGPTWYADWNCALTPWIRPSVNKRRGSRFFMMEMSRISRFVK